VIAKPVTFPPGRSSRVTMLLATGSTMFAKTIGMVRVSRWTATVPEAVTYWVAPRAQPGPPSPCRERRCPFGPKE
jgi:hypothetical protein